ncbi:MAG TPA: type VI immunity family protein [Pseudoduganella sp.]
MYSTTTFDFSPLYHRIDLDGHDHLLVRPGIILTFYIDEPLAVTCSGVANLIDFFFSVVPKEVFRTYSAKDGYYKTLTSRQIDKDLRLLRSLPADYEGFIFDYSEAELGQAGAYDILFKAVNPSYSVPHRSNVVRLEFPENILDIWGEERLLGVIRDAAELLPFFSGHAGFAFKHALPLSDEALDASAPLLPRYLGFDTADYWMAAAMRGHTVTSHWINLLGPQLTEKLGGIEAMRAAVPDAEIKPLRNGTWIRGARLPPIGDVNRGAKDIGQLPNIARLLRPVRCPHPRSGHTDFDIEAWLSRFDDLPAKAWDNS